VALNCAAIPEALLEAELFGHTRGAFTGAVQGRIGRLEAAHGGTLFLDEIGELPLALQAKLLRFVECGELQRVGENEPVRVDVRIVAATHRQLGKMASAGTFRADLYYRLSVFLIQTPALADRRNDITLLAHHALCRLGRNEPAKTITPEAMVLLLDHSWPGNVRELEHTIERAWILSETSASIGVDDIDFGEACS
jgi:transcriptional regulator with PAS, ATPase and Fis domain